MAYAVAYPFGIVGIILTMLLVRRIFSIDVDLEVRNVEESAATSERTPDYIDLEVTNPNVDGLALRNLPFVAEVGVVFSRLLRGGTVTVPKDDSVVRLGDGLRLVGPKAESLGSPTCTAGVCWSFTWGDSGQLADRLARDARAREVGPGWRASDRRAHLEPGRKDRATYLVSFAGCELGPQGNRYRFVSRLCRFKIRKPFFGSSPFRQRLLLDGSRRGLDLRPADDRWPGGQKVLQTRLPNPLRSIGWEHD